MRLLPALASLLLASFPALADYSSHPRAGALLETLRDNHGFSSTELSSVSLALREAQRLPQLVEMEQKAPERTETWTRYARRVDEDRVNGGVSLLRSQQEILDRAEEEFGVPPPVIAAILGIETRYGRLTGNIRVLDALATQGFEHPTRSPFFYGELQQFFVFSRDFRLPAQELKGSYAGAMGAAQFMPSNYLRLSLDYDGDGRRDLWSLPDAIGSIGHYFMRYRPKQAWNRGEPLAVRARLLRPLPADTEVNGKATVYNLGALLKAGYLASEVELPPDTPVGIIQLPLDDGGSEYWLGLHNFYTVMTYNPRTFYAMAVTQLAQRIERQLAAEAR
ncbi:MAG TPA: lytic murein transglycosylase [Solimonas sp.]|nr:lytic murein transglycosylase [Solimonas sp.]